MKISELKSLSPYIFAIIVAVVLINFFGIALIQILSAAIIAVIGVTFNFLNSRKSQKEKIESEDSLVFEDEKEINEKISTYLNKEREDVLNTIAPGSTKLLIREIVENGELFISPQWANYMGDAQSEELIEYLRSRLLLGKKILLLGDAGQGKTTIFKRVFTIMVDSFLWDSSNVIPIFIPLRDFAYSEDNNGKTLLQLWEYLSTNPRNPLPLTYEQFTSRREKIALFFYLMA